MTDTFGSAIDKGDDCVPSPGNGFVVSVKLQSRDADSACVQRRRVADVRADMVRGRGCARRTPASCCWRRCQDRLSAATRERLALAGWNNVRDGSIASCDCALSSNSVAS